jgi:Ca2+-binding EF-hand superfamily protein
MKKGEIMQHIRFHKISILMPVIFVVLSICTIINISEGQNLNSIDQYDKNNDGKLSKEEFPGSDAAFDNLDKNQDGYIDTSETSKRREPKRVRDQLDEYDTDNDG